MPPRRILLTGASGFVAGHLIPRLREAFPDAELCGVGAVAVDVSDPDAVHALVRDVRPDACVHLAAVSTVLGARRDQGRRAARPSCQRREQGGDH